MSPMLSQKRAQTVEARISAVLLEVEPLLRIEHCKLELVSFAATTGLLTLRIGGACPDCAISPDTFAPAITAHVRRRVPEVKQVSLGDPGS